MKKLISIAVLFVVCAVEGQVSNVSQLVDLPLPISGVDPYTYSNAFWWTNSPVPTNIATWQAHHALRRDVLILSNVLANSSGGSLTAAVTNQWRLDATNAAQAVALAATNGLVAGATLTSAQVTNALPAVLTNRITGTAAGVTGLNLLTNSTTAQGLTGNQTVTLSGDATGSGATAIAVTVTNVQGIITNRTTGTAAGVTGLNLLTNGVTAQGLTGNQTISLSGDATGSGATAITVTVTNFSGSAQFGRLVRNAVEASPTLVRGNDITNFVGLTTSGGITGSAANGTLTNSVAGYYLVEATLIPGTASAGEQAMCIYTNGTASDVKNSTYLGMSGSTWRGLNLADAIYLAANTKVTVRVTTDGGAWSSNATNRYCSVVISLVR